MVSTAYTVAPQLTLTASPAVDTTCTPNTTINLSAGAVQDLILMTFPQMAVLLILQEYQTHM